MARKYELNKRATRQEETRHRIVEAAVALHAEVGPARTSISAIAERAGVERLTVYRHFSTEQEIFHACSQQFDALHPLPDLAAWSTIADPFERLQYGLTDLYRYFAETEWMMAAVIRDAPSTPSMHETFARYQHGFESITELLTSGFESSGPEASWIRPSIQLATSFYTWQTLVHQQQMSNAEAVSYQLRVVRCLIDAPCGARASEK